MTKIQAATDGNIYVPAEERTGNESIVYFTRDISPEGIMKAYEKVCANMTGKVAVKLHTGEKNGPNFTPDSWVKKVMENEPTLKTRRSSRRTPSTKATVIRQRNIAIH